MRITWNNIQVPTKSKSILKWIEEYASLVHEGDAEYPSRPWVDEARRDFESNFDGYVADALNPADYKQTFHNIAEKFGEVCQDKMEEPIYQWPRQTKRRNQEIAGSPRDIIDLRDLQKSYRINHE